MIFATGLGRPEGPLLMPDGSWLVVEMAPDRGCVTRIEPQGQIVDVLAHTGRPNGLALDATGNVWIAESEEPALLRMTPDGTIESFLTGCDGNPFLWPNDLAFGPDGALFLTDSGIRVDELAQDGTLRPDWRTVPIGGRVYRIDTDTRAITQIDEGLRFANGVAVGFDDMLYVSETFTGNVYRYSLDGENVGPRELFANVLIPTDEQDLAGPDGMKFAQDGDLYVTVVHQGNITVLSPEGTVRRRIPTDGNFPSNIAFGPAGSEKVYVTEDQFGNLEVLDVGVDGIPLYDGTAKQPL